MVSASASGKKAGTAPGEEIMDFADWMEMKGDLYLLSERTQTCSNGSDADSRLVNSSQLLHAYGILV